MLNLGMLIGDGFKQDGELRLVKERRKAKEEKEIEYLSTRGGERGDAI